MNNYSEQKAYILQDDWITLYSIYEIVSVKIADNFGPAFVGIGLANNAEQWFPISTYQDKLLTFEQVFNKIKGNEK